MSGVTGSSCQRTLRVKSCQNAENPSYCPSAGPPGAAEDCPQYAGHVLFRLCGDDSCVYLGLGSTGSPGSKPGQVSCGDEEGCAVC